MISTESIERTFYLLINSIRSCYAHPHPAGELG